MQLTVPGKLAHVTATETLSEEGFVIEAAFLEFEDSLGRKSEVYAERCLIERSPAPALVHCPGGGQTVNRADLLDWAKKGFSVVSFDWQIGDYAGHDPAKKSRWPEGVVGQGGYIRREEEAILPMAVQGAGVCIDWLIESGRVNPEAIGVTGISWGGYLTWLVAAYEPRIKAAVPVYGAGGQFDERHPGYFNVTPEMNRVWLENWDPFSIAGRQTKPVCYLSSTNDFFGIFPLASELVSKLSTPHRRGWLPNCNHSISPGESALGLAWFKHYLDDGPALPEEPMLDADFSLAVDRETDVLSTEIWWTPELKDGDLGCWIEGTPPGAFAAAYGRIHYKQGYTLSTPVIYSGSPTGGQNAVAVPETYPSIRDGIGWNWGMGSTQFYGNDVSIEELGKGVLRIHRDPDRTDEWPSFYLNQFAHPGWNHGRQKAVSLTLRTDPAIELKEVKVILLLRGSSRRSEITTTVPITDNILNIDLKNIPAFPAMHSWKSVTRIEVQINTKARSFIIGPLVRI